MCQYFDVTTCPEGGFVADRDIVCYKVLRYSMSTDTARSPFFSSETWSVGDVRESRVRVDRVGINEGFVFCRRWGRYRENAIGDGTSGSFHFRYDVRKNPDIGIIEEGLHSYSGYMNGEMEELLGTIGGMLNATVLWMIFRCAIPEGSRYYVSDSAGVFVSDALRVDGLANVYATNNRLGEVDGFMLGVKAGVHEAGRQRDWFLRKREEERRKNEEAARRSIHESWK